MPCDTELLTRVPLFALLDDAELAVLAERVETKEFSARRRIFKAGDPGGTGYIVVSGSVVVTMIDEDHQEVIVSQPGPGEFFGFASMLEQTAHQTSAVCMEDTVCVAVDRGDLQELLRRKPDAGLDLMTVMGSQMHAAQELARTRALRNANELIEEEATLPERIADAVAQFGGSWAFITSFLVVLVAYTCVNILMGRHAWDPYPFILLNLFLSMLAAIQAPVIMMSQNRQDKKDRLRGELDFDVNRRAEAEVQGLARKLNLMNEKIGDLEEMLRQLR